MTGLLFFRLFLLLGFASLMLAFNDFVEWKAPPSPQKAIVSGTTDLYSKRIEGRYIRRLAGCPYRFVEVAAACRLCIQTVQQHHPILTPSPLCHIQYKRPIMYSILVGLFCEGQLIFRLFLDTLWLYSSYSLTHIILLSLISCQSLPDLFLLIWKNKVTQSHPPPPPPPVTGSLRGSLIRSADISLPHYTFIVWIKLSCRGGGDYRRKGLLKQGGRSI